MVGSSLSVLGGGFMLLAVMAGFGLFYLLIFAMLPKRVQAKVWDWVERNDHELEESEEYRKEYPHGRK